MPDVTISKINELYIKLDCSADIRFFLYDQFCFEVPGFKFMPKFKSGMWDGKIRLFSSNTGKIYHGLFDQVTKVLDENNFTWVVKDDKNRVDEKSKLSIAEIDAYIDSLKFPYELYDYQRDTIIECITNHRKLILSPTSSGKTTSIFALANYYKQFGKVLILFPTTSLILQTKKEFISFGADAGDIHEIMEDRAKNTDKSIVLSTWQGIYTQPKSYFQQYSTIITDEAHTATAKSLTTILENLENCKYRFGFTGTLDGSKVNKLILTGLFGDCKQVTTTTKLIENQQISDVRIKIVILKHKYRMFQNYSEEINYLIQDEKRNNVILNLVGKIKGNTLILTSRVEQHAIPLYNSIKNKYSDKCVHIVYGDIDTDDREEIRGLVETQDNAVIVASYQTYQAGISIKNLHNIIFALPSKSKIRNLQSIGRGLRLHKSKTHASIYDIADDISKGEHKNYTYNHLLSRINYYAAEELNFETIELNLNK